MKTYQVTAQTLFSAARRQWKPFLAVVLAFAVLGAAGGWVYADRESSAAGGGGAQALPALDFQTVAYTQSYYTDCLQALSDASRLLDSYMNTAFSSGLPEGPSQEALLERQTALNTEKREFQQTVLAPLQYTLQDASAIYVPEEFLDDLAQQYESQLATVRMDLIASEAATETIRQMSAPNYDTGPISGNYQNLISQAAQYGTLLKNQAVYETILDQLQNEPERVRAGSRRVQRELESAAQALNALMDEASQTVAETCLAANLSIRLQPNGSGYDVIAEHTYRAVPVRETYIAAELFCVLVGVCAGAFLAVCREAKRRPAPEGEG